MPARASSVATEGPPTKKPPQWPADKRLALVFVSLLGLLAVSAVPVRAQTCVSTHYATSPPPIVQTVSNDHYAVTVLVDNAWIATVKPTGSMRPAVQDGSKVIMVSPDLRLLVPGRVILFYHPGQGDQRVLHRIYSEGADSVVPLPLLGRGPSGWTLAEDGQWYEPGVMPSSPALDSRYWLTKGDNNCLPDFWQVHYKDILGVMVGVIE